MKVWKAAQPLADHQASATAKAKSARMAVSQAGPARKRPAAKGLPAVRGVNLEVHAGEVLGIAGVSGNGQRELAEAIAGLRAPTQGRITIDDAEVTTHHAQHAGMGDDENLAARELPCEVGERRRHPFHDGSVGLEPRRPAVGLQIPRPVALDLVMGEPLPLAHVGLAESTVGREQSEPQGAGDDRCGDAGPVQVAAGDRIERAETVGCPPGLFVAKVGEVDVGLSLPPSEGVPLALAMAQHEETGGGHGCQG